jgi:hypothetical protein
MALDMTDDPSVVSEVSGAVAEGGRDFDVCRLSYVVCRDLVPRAIRLTNVVGRFSPDRLAPPIETLEIIDGDLKHPVNFASLPRTLLRLRLERVRMPFSAPSPARVAFGTGRRRLESLSIVACGIEAADLSGVPALQALDLSNNALGDRLDLAALPRTLTKLNLSRCELSGAAQERLSLLPPLLKDLDVSHNSLTGTIPCSFASNLRSLRLAHNSLSGALCDSLPPTLEILDVESNRFGGALGDMSEWWSLTTFRGGSNRFAAVPWGSLPPSLLELSLGNNAIAGSLPVDSLPSSLQVLNVSSNRLDGALDLGGLPRDVAFLDVSRNSLSGTPDVSRLPVGVRDVFLHTNNFSGALALADMPVGLRRIVFHDNPWHSELPSEFADLV